MKLLSCPICHKKFLSAGLENHIINKAESDAFKSLNQLLDATGMKPYEFSPIVLIRQTPHLRFFRRNVKAGKKKLKM